MTTLSVINADTGGWVGRTAVHPDMTREAEQAIERERGGLLADGQVATCGDDLFLVLTHERGEAAEPVHRFAWETFSATARVAEERGLYGAGQDLLSDAFAGNLRGLRPGFAELDVSERPSETVLIYLADKTEPGAWNLPLYKMFADPFNTAGLVIDPKMHQGFRFEVHDLVEGRRIRLDCPEEAYDLLLFIGAPSRYVVKHVESRTLGEPAAVTSTQRLSLMAGRYVGKDDPVMVVRCQSGMPAVGEATEPFAAPHVVAGCMRGSHHAPLMPVGLGQDHPSRFDGPPRVVCLGYQLRDGALHGPRDLFADPAFDRARQQAGELMDHLRRHGPFEPHRLPLDEMEYTSMPAVAERLADRWEPAEEPGEPAAAPGAGATARSAPAPRRTPAGGADCRRRPLARAASTAMQVLERRPGRTAGEERVVLAGHGGEPAAWGLRVPGRRERGLRPWADLVCADWAVLEGVAAARPRRQPDGGLRGRRDRAGAAPPRAAGGPPLGLALLAVGCRWFKDWYFPEAGREGGTKLQGTLPLDAAHRRRPRPASPSGCGRSSTGPTSPPPTGPAPSRPSPSSALTPGRRRPPRGAARARSPPAGTGRGCRWRALGRGARRWRRSAPRRSPCGGPRPRCGRAGRRRRGRRRRRPAAPAAPRGARRRRAAPRARARGAARGR